ncbi:hypothetical protein AB0N16_36605 [Streptomyces sp. NPDC051105]
MPKTAHGRELGHPVLSGGAPVGAAGEPESDGGAGQPRKATFETAGAHFG